MWRVFIVPDPDKSTGLIKSVDWAFLESNIRKVRRGRQFKTLGVFQGSELIGRMSLGYVSADSVIATPNLGATNRLPRIAEWIPA